MEYCKFGNDYIVRIAKGEEILATLSQLCEKEEIKLGTVMGIGAVNKVTLGVFNSVDKKYESTTYTGDMEISSCTGNISTMDGKPYLHIHMVVGNTTKNLCYAGHLNNGLISLTGEFYIHKIDGCVDREFSEEIGLNLYKFN